MDILNGRGDALDHWAATWLRSASVFDLCGAVPSRDFNGGSQFSVIAADGLYQVELVVCQPNVVIPEHVHPRVDSIEVPIAGRVRLQVRGDEPFKLASDAAFSRLARRRGVRIDSDAPHSGVVGDGGAVFLSIQRWHDSPVTSIATRYAGQAASEQHERSLEH
jgi:hypothetical protein